MELGLEGKVVAITGAARGLGLAAARAFLREGAKVLSVDRSFEPGGAADNDVHRRAVVDISSEEGAASVPRPARSAFGRLDNLVLNAGRHSSQSLVSLTLSEFDLTFSTNVLGATFALREYAAALPVGGADAAIGSTAT